MSGKKSDYLEFDCLPIKQHGKNLYVFSAKASSLWSVLEINQREEDKDTGYQRVISPSRVRAISKYVDSKKIVAPSILVTFDHAEIINNKKIKIENRRDAGWVIDGQHRLAGAAHAENDIELAVVAFIDLDIDEQISQFITINREAKGVPTSLYYDLLKHLPHKKPAEAAKERAADIASILKTDESSPFFGRIVVTTTPKRGELSLTNFVRKVSPLIHEGKGIFESFSEQEQRQIIENYYKAVANIFSKEFSKLDSIFFQTLGFGALMNSLPTIFNISVKNFGGFAVEDATKVLREVSDFDIDAWKKIGSGSAAEIQAGKDIESEVKAAFNTIEGGTIRL